MSSLAKIAVIVASKGRSDRLRSLIPFLNAQSHLPAQLLFVVTEPSDADFDLASLADPAIKASIAFAKPGLTRQRNLGLSLLDDSIEHVVFFDDDYLPSRYALEGIARAFDAFPDVDGITGRLLADGINSEGVSLDVATRMIAAVDNSGPPQTGPNIRTDTVGLYGCNMAMRRSAIAGLRFDERLPVYGWQEDVDFAAQIPGRKVETDAFWGVHLGAKDGRETNGARLGYSQVVNPYYLYRKGTVDGRFLLRLSLRNIVANHLKALRPEPWVDRIARLRGNWIGIGHILTGRADPEHILRWSGVQQQPRH